MGFIKYSDGDSNHTVEKVFRDADEMIEEIVKNMEKDDMEKIPTEELPIEESN